MDFFRKLKKLIGRLDHALLLQATGPLTAAYGCFNKQEVSELKQEVCKVTPIKESSLASMIEEINYFSKCFENFSFLFIYGIVVRSLKMTAGILIGRCLTAELLTL